MSISPEALELWNRNWSLRMIARHLGCSAMGVKKYLNRVGVDTRVKLIEVKCYVCGKSVNRNRARVRTNRKNFCGRQCYWKHLESVSSVRSRNGLRHARKKVARYMKLDHEMVVHHEDGNELNNELKNLVDFITA